MASAPGESQEYPTKEDLIQAAVIAVITGILGFLVTYTIFVKPYRKDKSLAGLDRQAAEASKPVAYRQSDNGALAYVASYTAAGASAYESRKSKLNIVSPEHKQILQDLPQATPTPQVISLPLPEVAYQQRRSRLQVHAPKLNVNEEVSANTASARPVETSWEEAWQRVRTGWVTLGDGLHTGGQGLLVSETQILTTLSAFRSGNGQCSLNGQRIFTTLMASDSHKDLALLQVRGHAPGVPVPLSPDALEYNQIYLCGDQLNQGRTVELRSLGQAGPCMAFDGFPGSIDGGVPIINRRGEMVAMALAAPPWVGMSWNVALSASDCKTFIDSHPRGEMIPPVPVELWIQAICSRVQVGPGRETPTRANARIVPGQALGNYPLGLSAQQLQKELGQGEVTEHKGGFRRVYYNGPRLIFTLANDVVVAIETDYHFYTLEGGVAVGSDKEPEGLRTQLLPALVARTAAWESLASSGVEILFNKGKVSSIRVVPK